MKKTLDVEKLLAEMTLEEKAQMCSGLPRTTKGWGSRES